MKVTSDGQLVTILTTVHWWHGHYDPTIRRPRRCGGQLCRYCDDGRQPELRIVLGVADGAGQRHLLELRERHRDIIEQLEGQAEGIVGTRIVVGKVGTALNSPVEVIIRNHRESATWDIRLLVDGLGVTD